VPAATLGEDYFRFEEANRALVGTRTKETFRLGGSVNVRLVEAAPFAGALRFEIVRPGSESRVQNRVPFAPRKPIYKGKRR
jgi:ribonuclease R